MAATGSPNSARGVSVRSSGISYALCGVASVFLALVAVRVVGPLIRLEGDTLRVQDFSYHYLISTITRDTSGAVPYSDVARASLLREVCLRDLQLECSVGEHVMPTALSPIGFVLLWLATRIFGLGVQGASGAYTVMLGASFFFWFQFLTRMITRESSRSTISRSIVLVAAICVMASDAFISAIRLGQPSILVVGVVGLVTLGARRLIPFLLVLSSIKPHYFLLAISLAAVCRAWREMAYGFVTLAFLTVAGVSLFGASLIEEYPQVLLRYARGMSFAWYTNPLSVGPILGIAPQMLGGLGSVLGVLVAVWAVWSRSIITTALIPVVYLLTSPYVGNYEQVLLLVPLVAWSSRSTGLVGNDSPTTTKRLARIDES